MSDLDDLLAPPPLDSRLDLAPAHVIENIVLRFLARVVNADGTIAGEELSLLVGIAVQLGLDGGDAKRILDDELQQASDPAQLAAQLPDEGRRREVYAMGCLMGATDGTVADAERAVLASFAQGAGIPPADAENILATVVDATKKA